MDVRTGPTFLLYPIIERENVTAARTPSFLAFCLLSKKEKGTFFSHPEQVQAVLLQPDRHDGLHGPGALPPGELGLVVGQPGHARPGVVVGRAQRAEDAEQLVDLAVAGEQGLLVDLRMNYTSRYLQLLRSLKII